MGGYAAGEVASDIAVSVIMDVIQQHFLHQPIVPDDLWQVLVDAVLEANTAIIAAALDEPSYRGMGATLVSGLFHGSRLVLAHAGDSRAYRLRSRATIRCCRSASTPGCSAWSRRAAHRYAIS
jgi:PPM family protein phosphatase